MQTSEKNMGWEDLIFIPPGKSLSQHIQDVVKAWSYRALTSTEDISLTHPHFDNHMGEAELEGRV